MLQFDFVPVFHGCVLVQELGQSRKGQVSIVNNGLCSRARWDHHKDVLVKRDTILFSGLLVRRGVDLADDNFAVELVRKSLVRKANRFDFISEQNRLW